jgi:hypothetical protein
MMDHGLMLGMLIAGIVLSAFPIALGVAIGVLALKHYRAARRPGAEGRAP